MATNTIIILMATTSLSTVMIIVAMFTLFNNISKKMDVLNDRVAKLESKFDRLDERYNSTNLIVEKNETESKEVISEIKNQIKEVKLENQTFMEKLFDLINKNAQKPVL